MSLELPATLGLAETENFAAVLCEQVERGEPLLIGGSQVEKIGLAGLQMLLSARKSATAAGIDFKIENCSKPLTEMAALAGLHQLVVY